MKIDVYTKTLLTIIVAILTAIACRPLVNPDTSAVAQSTALSGVQVTGQDRTSATFFDSRTGELWALDYSYAHGNDVGINGAKSSTIYPPSWTYRGKVSRLGTPLAGAEKWQLEHCTWKPCKLAETTERQ